MKTQARLLLVSSSALAAGVAQGAIHYSGPLNNVLSCPASGAAPATGFYTDVNGDGLPDLYIGFDGYSAPNTQKPFMAAYPPPGAYSAQSAVLARPSTNIVNSLPKVTYGFPVTPSGTIIDKSFLAPDWGSANYNAAYFYKNGDATTVGDWLVPAKTEGYVGLALYLGNPATTTNYAWAHIICDSTVTPATLTLVDYAYEDGNLVGIIAGATNTLGAPFINTEPQSQMVAAGANVQLSVGVLANPAPAYQWAAGLTGSGVYSNLTDGGPVSGSTTPTLSINGITADRALDYIVVVTNILGQATSSPPATLTVVVPFIPPAPPVATIWTNIPIMDKGYGVIGRDDGLSVMIGTNCCYFFGDTVLTQANALGSHWVVNTMYHTTSTNGDSGVTGGYNWISNGVPPMQFIPYTADEMNWIQTNVSKNIIGIWPYGQFYSPTDGKQYISFGSVIETANLPQLGTGLAICPTNPVTTGAARVLSRPGSAQPYLLWDASAGEWGDMAATLSNYVYFYWVNGTNYGNVYVARASLLGGPDFLTQSNWQYWSGATWVTNNPSSAASILSGAGVGTIDWNGFLTNASGGRGCYLYTYMSWVGNNIYTRASSDLVHWSAPTLQYTVPVSWGNGYFPYFGRAHKCLERNNGQIAYISWSLPDTNITQNEDIPMIKAQFPPVNPAFGGLTTSQSITYGKTNIILGGTVSANGLYPASGETISVTINGNAQIAIFNDATGDFSLNYNSAALPASFAPYPITYAYAGDAWLNAASDSSTTLTVFAPPVIQSAAVLTGSVFQLTWGTVTNQLYQIQATPGLSPANWTIVAGPLAASGSTLTYTQAMGTNLQRFYRVVLLP